MRATALLACALLAAQQTPAQMPALSQAENLIESHDFAQARQLVLQALAANPKDVRAVYDLGYIEESTDHAKEAEQDYRQAISLDATLPQPHLALARVLQTTGRDADARAERESVAQDDKAEPALRAEALRALATADADAHPEAAQQELLQALKLSPETPDDTWLTARLAQAQGDDTVAAQAYQRLLDSKQMVERATAQLAAIERKQKRYADMVQLLTPAHQQFPDDPMISAELANALAATGKPEQALPLLEQAHAADPTNQPVTRMLADIDNEFGHPEAAEPLYVALLRDTPKDPDLLAAYGACLVREKRYFEAVPPLESAVALKPALGDAWGSLAFANSRLERYDQTLKDLAERKKYLPDNASTYYLWGIAYDRLRRIKEAEEYYRLFLEAAGGKFPDQEFQVRHRLAAMEHK